MTDTSNIWISWSGGECPVDTKATVVVRFRYRHHGHHSESRPKPAGVFSWKWTDGGADIIAYRILEPSA